MSGSGSPHRTHAGTIVEQLRLATVLAHTVPGVLLELTCCHGERIGVGYGNLGSQLTPCQLRGALLAPPELGIPRLADAVVAVEVVAGLDHLGGGLYQRGARPSASTECRPHDGSTGERWFASTLPHEQIGLLMQAAPIDLPHHLCAVRLVPDSELDVTAVRIGAASDSAVTSPGQLDEVAFWALSVCMVAELDAGRQA